MDARKKIICEIRQIGEVKIYVLVNFSEYLRNVEKNYQSSSCGLWARIHEGFIGETPDAKR
jgi:hypothetical protein